MKYQESDVKKALHLLKSISGQYRKKGLSSREVNQIVKKKLADILFYRTVYSGIPNIKMVSVKPYYIALKILEYGD